MTEERTPVLTRREVESLARFRPVPYLVTSLYLALDHTYGPGPGRGRQATLRKLIRDARAVLVSRDLSRKQRQSVEEDLGALERLTRDAQARRAKGVCAFVASGADYEQVFDLPHPVKSRLVFDAGPYLGPLAATLAEYPRCLVVLIDRTRARLLAAHLGRARDLLEIASDVPAQVKEGGYRGNAERHIGRHIEDHVLRHEKRVAEVARETFGERDFDWLVLGGPAESVAGLKEELSPALRPLLAGEIAAGLDANASEVAGLCQARMGAHVARRNEDLVRRLEEALVSSGTGVAGLAATLGALRRGAIGSLLVLEGHAEPGTECRACGFLAPGGLVPAGGACRACGATAGTRPVPDLVTEVTDRAAGSGARVWHIATEPAASRLRTMGGIGALLRFRLV